MPMNEYRRCPVSTDSRSCVGAESMEFSHIDFGLLVESIFQHIGRMSNGTPKELLRYSSSNAFVGFRTHDNWSINGTTETQWSICKWGRKYKVRLFSCILSASSHHMDTAEYRFVSEGSCEVLPTQCQQYIDLRFYNQHFLTEAGIERARSKPCSNHPTLSVCEDRITPPVQNSLTAVTIQDDHGCYQDSDSDG